jgi:bifunctional DNA-binding transcriptional regulator/antitoxin component of YhaV-PrlF toxin-antitoxin module
VTLTQRREEAKAQWKESTGRLLTLGTSLSQSICVKITGKGQVTIPPAMRKKHGLLPQREVEFVDQPDGVLVVKAGKLSRGKRVLAALLRGGKVKGDTANWLRLTRDAA